MVSMSIVLVFVQVANCGEWVKECDRYSWNWVCDVEQKQAKVKQKCYIAKLFIYTAARRLCLQSHEYLRKNRTHDMKDLREQVAKKDEMLPSRNGQTLKPKTFNISLNYPRTKAFMRLHWAPHIHRLVWINIYIVKEGIWWTEHLWWLSNTFLFVSVSFAVTFSVCVAHCAVFDSGEYMLSSSLSLSLPRFSLSIFCHRHCIEYMLLLLLCVFFFLTTSINGITS